MKEKSFKNLKNKIGLKNFFVSKNQQVFKPKNINLKTINIQKYFNEYQEDKNFFQGNNLNNFRYLNSINNYNIVTKNDYFQKKKRNSLFNSSDSERVPSPISLMGSSSYIPSGKKKYKKRRYPKKVRNNRYNTNTSTSSIHNLSFNSNNSKNNISYIYSSSSSSEDEEYNEYTDSSEASYKSREKKRKEYLDKMLVEENELDYLNKSEVGLNSIDEEDNNNSNDNNNSMEENFSNEIEKILIETYNRNISIITQGNINEYNKSFKEIQDTEKQIKKCLKRENIKIILLVLKCLSNKIKELIGKYKEKIFEIEEMKTIKATLQRQILNEQIIRCNNSLESNVATNYNSNESYNSYNEEENFKNNLILNMQDEISKKGVTYTLLRELINIKRTLKISAKEIEIIFKYPLNLLKNEEGKKIKFSVEYMQREEFCKILLEDELISYILNQIKENFYGLKYQKITKWILELDECYTHKNEMTKFIKYINDRIPNNKIQNENNVNDNNYLEELRYDEEKINENDINDNNLNNINPPLVEMNKKIKKKKKKENKEEEKIEEIKEETIDELKFKDIDEILNYINDETDSKKGKKKCKKNKKNKNKNLNKEEEKENQTIKNSNNNITNEDIENNNFEKEFEKFKNEIINDTMHLNEINTKIKPCLSKNFLNSISII